MKQTESKALNFFKRNAVYLILAFCILAIGLSVTLVLVHRNNEAQQLENPLEQEDPSDNTDLPSEPEEPDDPVDVPGTEEPDEPVIDVIEFIMPVENATEIAGYSESMVFNSTLGRFSAHTAIDFFAAEGTPVYAVEDGTVESVTNGILEGVTVIIDHGDGLKTVYNSLADPDEVSVGQKVARGDKIGEVSVTNRQEYKDGAHLHFEVTENGETIDPGKYLVFEEK